MKKKELLHLHGLLGMTAKELIADGAVSEADLTEYEKLGTSPMAMRGSRDDHEEATLALADALAGSLNAETTESETDADPRHALAT